MLFVIYYCCILFMPFNILFVDCILYYNRYANIKQLYIQYNCTMYYCTIVQ